MPVVLDAESAAVMYVGGAQRERTTDAVRELIEAGVEIEGARLWDIAPTLLRLLDQPIPKDMDGRIVDALLPKALVAAGAETKYADAAEAQSDDAVPTYSEDEEAVIQERLQGLGYLE